MLQLKNITKRYITGEFKQDALKKVSVSFRENEFVAVLGPSGSGKTTLLNIIGGLDRYTSGDLIINGKSTKLFKATDWDAYRNNSIGFVFQNYYLIGHLNILSNVELALTLSGVNAKTRKKKAREVLKRVGLLKHAKKLPSQLSGGQMQRVAIARSLINDPDIILADEPTGALDSETSKQILNLIKEIAKDKLVIMVTHNAELAEQYATRIIKLKDGEIIHDSNPVKEEETLVGDYKLKKTAMSFFTALKLSFNNILTKKWRTLLTSFASSIGIIGIALIMSLSHGFDIKIKEFEVNTISQFPILISQEAMEVNAESMQRIGDNLRNLMDSEKSFPDVQEIYPYNQLEELTIHQNRIKEEYVKYIEAVDPKLVSGISYTRVLSLNLLNKVNGKVQKINTDFSISLTNNISFTSLPKNLDPNKKSKIEQNYDLLYGKYPTEINELVLIVDPLNRVEKNLLANLGFNIENAESIPFEDIIGTELKLIMNDDFYIESNNMFIPNQNLEEVYNSPNAITLKIVGIIRVNPDSKMPILREGIAYQNELAEMIIENAKNSKIVKKQLEVDYNVMTQQQFNMSTEKELFLATLGAYNSPYIIMVYPEDFDTKAELLTYLDEYNKNKDEADRIIYNDLSEIMVTLSGNIMDAITIVLVAFSSISLVVSVIMIGIITYISVLERTKEIGVLRALGARKKDITRVFNAETFIIGLFSGTLGIFIAWLLQFPTNSILESLTTLPNIAKINPVHVIILITVSLVLTIIGGLIPAKFASTRDPVVALRAE
ncbi:MAG TPA: ATP-binding cassette domain-containing protein [Tenericutes bacterium]|nr:ATP-binding cassette domain-containing protein [Mycoplasmatota bacterium]